MITLRGTGPAPVGYVRCASPDCPCAGDGSHYHPQIAPELVPFEGERQRPDPRPGFYYVSAIDGTRKVFARGPFPTHREALAVVDATRAIVNRGAPFDGNLAARVRADLEKEGLLVDGELRRMRR